MSASKAASVSSLLLFADGRLPVGAHANSAGVEWAARFDEFRNASVLERWVRGRLRSTGTVDAAFAVSTGTAITTAVAGNLADIEHELAARMPGTRARFVSRQLGRQFARAAGRVWPHLSITSPHEDGLYAPMALGAVAGGLNLEPVDIATVSLHHTVSAASTAAIRLLGLDPLEIAAMQARLAPVIDDIAESAQHWCTCELANLPATTSPLADILAQDHGEWSQRLFVA